ncbi:MAG: hypothetical protein Q9166_007470 [cf. Caloplaca sp. 2 TL-2023]
MAPSMQEGPVVVPTATVPSSQQSARQRLPIIPAIPRKLEKQLRKTSGLAAGSRSAADTALEPSTTGPINCNGESTQVDEEGPDNDRDTATADEQPTNGVPNAASQNDSREENPAVEGTPTVKEISPTVGFPPPSILDPECPPFVPEPSRTPSETLDGTSNLSEENGADGKLAESAEEFNVPQVPYPIQTTATASWAPCQPTSPAVPSPFSQPYSTYGQSPLLYGPASFHHDKYPR